MLKDVLRMEYAVHGDWKATKILRAHASAVKCRKRQWEIFAIDFLLECSRRDFSRVREQSSN
jgi:hypothetical protein